MLTGQIQFAQKVGTAPSTTTMLLGSAGAGLGIQCFPVPSVQERNAWIGVTPAPAMAAPTAAAPAAPAAPARLRRLNPYVQEVEMRGLGVPSESYAWMTGRVYSQPPGTPRGTTALVFSGANQVGLVDPNDAWRTGDVNRVRMHGTVAMRINPQRGGGYTEQLLSGLGITNNEATRSLSGLGTVPNDDELARNLCYTPVHSGWIYGNRPTGEKYYVDGFYGAASAQLLADDEAVSIQRKQMVLQGIATFAIVGLATASIWSALRGAPVPARARKRKVTKKKRRR